MCKQRAKVFLADYKSNRGASFNYITDLKLAEKKSILNTFYDHNLFFLYFIWENKTRDEWIEEKKKKRVAATVAVQLPNAYCGVDAYF